MFLGFLFGALSASFLFLAFYLGFQWSSQNEDDESLEFPISIHSDDQSYWYRTSSRGFGELWKTKIETNFGSFELLLKEYFVSDSGTLYRSSFTPDQETVWAWELRHNELKVVSKQRIDDIKVEDARKTAYQQATKYLTKGKVKND